MHKYSLEAITREQLAKALESKSKRAAETVYGGKECALRQTVIGMAGGTELAEHESPGEATIYVLQGRIRLVAGDDHWDGREGDFLIVPPARHSLEALSDAAVLLTVSKARK